MSDSKPEHLSKEKLRAEAEKKLILNDREDYSNMSAIEIAGLVYELKTHQIELEMQNEAMHRAQEELLIVNEEYSELYEFAPVGYITMDEKGIIKKANLTLSDMIDVPRAELINKELQQFFIEDDMDALYLLQQKTLKNCGRQTSELRFSVSSGCLWVKVASTCVEDSDSANSLIHMVFTDISERKQAEMEQEQIQRELNQNHKMAALGQLAGGIAHDFNNILAIILGNTELAQNKSGSKDESDLYQYLSHIEQASIRGRDLVAKMLLFSRDTVSNDQALQLKPQIDDDIQLIKSIFPSSLKVNKDIAEDLPDILMDSIQFSQLLMNLCINARDAMDGKGIINLRVAMATAINEKCADCREIITGDWVELAIGDSGGGIDPEVLTKIFNPFYSTKGVGEGTGMGLSTVHGIMHSHKGHICVETEQGKGTVFRLLFPPVIETKKETTSRSSSLSQDITKGQGQRILIVDDEPALVGLLDEILQVYGYQPSAFTSSKKALEAFKQNPDKFDLIITDQTMPEITGIDLVKSIREIRPDIPVILNTGFSDNINKETANNLNIRILQKPVDTKLLCNSISDLIDTKKY